jgi:hypothetical protein
MQSEYTLTLPAHNPEQAAPLAKALLDDAQSKLGFIPNICRRHSQTGPNLTTRNWIFRGGFSSSELA